MFVIFTPSLVISIVIFNYVCDLLILNRLWKKLNARENTSSDEIQIAKVIIHMVDLFARGDIDLRNKYHLKYIPIANFSTSS